MISVKVKPLFIDDEVGTAFVREACSTTMRGRESKADIRRLLRAEHSPIRRLKWEINMVVPTFVSVHFVRHKIGVEHWVGSNRDDRGGDGEANRLTPVMHKMEANAQALIDMARKRLCWQASPETREAMHEIQYRLSALGGLSHDMANAMGPECWYRFGYCVELKCCGKWPKVKWANGLKEAGA